MFELNLMAINDSTDQVGGARTGITFKHENDCEDQEEDKKRVKQVGHLLAEKRLTHSGWSRHECALREASNSSR